MSGIDAAAAPSALGIGRRRAVAMFAAFALAYFLSALLRAVTATLAPAFSAELQLGAADLGLLAGAYFLSFALSQLPMGRALDRIGPRRVLLGLLIIAALACFAFSMARSLLGLWWARALIGVGVCACLMAPLTAFRRHFDEATQLRANSWMLMMGSLGMLSSTMPVQWVLPHVGWRGLFVVLGVAVLLSLVGIALLVPRDGPHRADTLSGDKGGYAQIFRHPYFLRLAPMAFVVYGGLLALQSLWAGPWLTEVAGHTPDRAARGLFLINLVMLLAFLAWGSAMPRLRRRGVSVDRLLTAGVPITLVLLAWTVARGPQAGAGTLAAWFLVSTVITLSQPAAAQVFAPPLAGRALSAYNLLIFLGVFCVQWGIGLAVDALQAHGWSAPDAHRAAFALFGVCSACAYLWYLVYRGKPR